MFHVIHNVKPLVIEGFELIISIITEHVKMMGIVENFRVVRELKFIRIITNSFRPLMKSPLFPYIWFFMDMSYFSYMDFSPAFSMTFLKTLESLASID